MSDVSQPQGPPDGPLAEPDIAPEDELRHIEAEETQLEAEKEQLEIRQEELEERKSEVEAEVEADEAEGGGETAAEGEEAPALEDMSKAELKEEAAAEGLPTSGTKDELIERIEGAEGEQA